jgi:hypothetical protein
LPFLLGEADAVARAKKELSSGSQKGSRAYTRAEDVKRYRPWLLASLVPIFVGGLALYLPRDNKQLLTSVHAWTASGSIAEALPGQVLSGETPFSKSTEDALYWIATPEIGDGSGRLVSQTVPAPGWTTFTVTGDLTRPGNHVYLELPEENKRIRVTAQTQPECWRRVTMALPGDWVGKPVRMILEASSRDTYDVVGISNPRALASGSVLLSHLRALAVLPVCVISLLLFLLPGLPLAARLAAGGVIATSRVVVVAVLFGCLAGYLTFWAYFCHRIFGYCFGGLVLVGGAALCAAALWRGSRTRPLILSVDVATPLALTVLVALFYVSLWHSVNLWIPFHLTPRLHFLDFVLLQDNIIPYFFADPLYKGDDPRQFMPEWQSSDRPPLQAGILLLQMPLGYLVGQPLPVSLIFSCALQCVWVPALWEFWTAAGLQRRRAGLALLLVILTGFMLVNSVFTWPKLLSAALTLSAISLAWFHRSPPHTDHPAIRASLWGLAAALAFLSHGGVAFTLLPFGLFLLLPRYYPGLLRLALAAGVFLVTVFPWNLYQKLYEPPGTKLIREHLAGKSKTWDDSRPMWVNLLDAYKDLGPGEILANKWANVEVLFRASEQPGEDHYPWPPHGSPKPWPVDAISLRRCEFLCLFWAPGLLNLGWIAAAVLAWRRPPVLDRTLGIAAPALALASIVVWVLLMFGPGTTVVHQGSYATMLLLFASLAAWLAVLPGRLLYVVLIAQGILFSVTWLFTSPANNYGLPNPFLIVGAIVFFALLCRLCLGAASSTESVGAG